MGCSDPGKSGLPVPRRKEEGNPQISLPGGSSKGVLNTLSGWWSPCICSVAAIRLPADERRCPGSPCGGSEGGLPPSRGFGCIPQEIPLGWVGNEGSESLEQRRHRFAGAARRPALRTDPSSDPHLPPGRCIQSTNSQTYISRDHPGQAAGIRGPLRGFR